MKSLPFIEFDFLAQPATSLGGVESLIEHRYGTDPTADPFLVRVSIGVEEFEVGSYILHFGCHPEHCK